MTDTIPIEDNMAEYITIKTKDEWGRESKIEFCVADIQKVIIAVMDGTEVEHLSPTLGAVRIGKANDSAASKL